MDEFSTFNLIHCSADLKSQIIMSRGRDTVYCRSNKHIPILSNMRNNHIPTDDLLDTLNI